MLATWALGLLHSNCCSCCTFRIVAPSSWCLCQKTALIDSWHFRSQEYVLSCTKGFSGMLSAYTMDSTHTSYHLAAPVTKGWQLNMHSAAAEEASLQSNTIWDRGLDSSPHDHGLQTSDKGAIRPQIGNIEGFPWPYGFLPADKCWSVSLSEKGKRSLCFLGPLCLKQAYFENAWMLNRHANRRPYIRRQLTFYKMHHRASWTKKCGIFCLWTLLCAVCIIYVA